MQKMLSLGVISLAAIASLVPLSHADSEMRHARMNSGSTLSGEQLACVRTAVATRETSVRSAYNTLYTAYLAGMDARAKALDTAWTMTDKTARKTARESAWSAWNTAAKSAREAFRSARKSAWDTFRSTAKTCKVPSSEIESTLNQNSDVQ